MCSFEMLLLHNVNVNDKVIIIADTRHSQRWSERKVDPTLCRGDLAFLCNCPTSLENLRLWAHECTPGVPRNVDDLETIGFADLFGTIAEDQHLTRCAQVCFAGTEEDQAEQHDHGTIDDVLGDPDMERGRDAPKEADQEAYPPEQIPLLDYPESRPCTFNHEVGIDVFEIIDSVSKRSLTVDVVCRRVAYVQVRVERKSERSSPSFHTSLQAYDLKNPRLDRFSYS